MKPLIVGAGPAGLTTALALTLRGVPVRIIERKEERDERSRAITLQPHTLELLGPLGVSERLIQAGHQVHSLHFCDRGKRRLVLDLPLLTLPQVQTERILEERLGELGVEVERGCEMVELAQDETGVTAQLRKEGVTTPFRCDTLISAEGALSWSRKSLGIPFNLNREAPHPWNLIDARMSWKEKADRISFDLHSDGHISAIFPIRPGLYRIATSADDARVAVPDDAELHEVLWDSAIRMEWKQAVSYQKGRIFLVGEAAISLPLILARGMNLGIEDALVLAEKIACGEEESYSKERLSAGKKAIAGTALLFKIQTSQNLAFRLLRNGLLYPLLRIRSIQRWILPKIFSITPR